MNKSDTNNNEKLDSCNGSSIDEEVIPSINPEKIGTKRDVQNTYKTCATIEPEQKRSNSLQHPQHIPNVFEDDIFDFLASRENPNNENELNGESPKTKGIATGAIPKTSWRSGSNGNSSHTARVVEQLRQISIDTDQSKKNGTTHQANAPSAHGIIQNGAVFTGVGIRPCATYQLNNMYDKFPHLNAGKVANPLIPPQTHKPRQIGTNNAQNTPAGLDKMNRRRETGSRDRNNLRSSAASNGNALVRRGHSSTDLTSVSKANDSTQRKNEHKMPAQPNGGAIPKQLNKTSAQPNLNKSPQISADAVSDTLIDSEKLKSMRL